MDEKTAGQLRELITKGAAGGLVLRTDDCLGVYERVRAKGVEFTQEATERGYGTDCGLRDPFGSAFPGPAAVARAAGVSRGR